jgi:hypothetical protein
MACLAPEDQMSAVQRRGTSRSDLAGPSSGWYHAARIWVPLEFRSRLSAAGMEF